MCLAVEVGERNINQLWVSPNLCVSRSAVNPSLPLPLSGNLTPARTVKNWESCQTAASAQGKEEMPGACVCKLHCRIRSWKITKQLFQSFYHIWFFFSPAALMNPSEMGSSERQTPYASSPQHRLRWGRQMPPAYILIRFCSRQLAEGGSSPKSGAGREKSAQFTVKPCEFGGVKSTTPVSGLCCDLSSRTMSKLVLYKQWMSLRQKVNDAW